MNLKKIIILNILLFISYNYVFSALVKNNSLPKNILLPKLIPQISLLSRPALWQRAIFAQSLTATAKQSTQFTDKNPMLQPLYTHFFDPAFQSPAESDQAPYENSDNETHTMNIAPYGVFGLGATGLTKWQIDHLNEKEKQQKKELEEFQKRQQQRKKEQEEAKRKEQEKRDRQEQEYQAQKQQRDEQLKARDLKEREQMRLKREAENQAIDELLRKELTLKKKQSQAKKQTPFSSDVFANDPFHHKLEMQKYNDKSKSSSKLPAELRTESK